MEQEEYSLAPNDHLFLSAEAAFTELRKKGLAAASRKASRTAAEGLVGVFQDKHSAVVIELNSETDFVARNPKFQALARSIAKAAEGVQGQGSKGGAESLPLPALEVGPSDTLSSFRMSSSPCFAHRLLLLLKWASLIGWAAFGS